MVTRRWFLLGILGMSILNRSVVQADEAFQPRRFRVYIGTYTDGASRGIYQSVLDVPAGTMTPPQLAAEIVSPSFVAIHPGQKLLYAVNETAEFEGRKTGAVTAFSIDTGTGALRVMNQQPSEGMHPCHLVVDAAGRHVLVANYSSGTVAVLPLETGSGRLGKAVSVIQHQGSGVNSQRQEAPHAHSINLDAGNRFAFAADLGIDQVLIYRYDAASGALTPNDPAAGRVAPGSGPRHFAFHPSQAFAFVNNELTSTVTVFRYDAEKGSLTPGQTLSTLPEGGFAGNSTAETVVHPNGRFVYVSNRGHDSIAIFEFDATTAQLTARGHQATGGKTPRNFNIDPTGTLLLAANQGTNDITVFRIDQKSGGLIPTDVRLSVGSPVCLRFLPLP